MPIPSQLERLARRLERDNLRLEAAAVRAVARAYRTPNLADLLALIAQVGDSPAPASRVAQLDRLLGAFDSAARTLQTPPAELSALLERAVATGVRASAEMLATAGGVLEAFRVEPTLELEYTRTASERLQRYWGIEQRRLADAAQSVMLEGLERGQGVRQVAAMLRERVSVSQSRANVIVRTELARASNSAQRETQLAAGLTEFVWRSAADARVRPAHRRYNGNVYSWADPPEGGPGYSPNCRCVSVPSF